MKRVAFGSARIGRFSIAQRLLALFVVFALAMFGVEWTLGTLTNTTVEEIEKLEHSLERRSAIVDLESAIGDYTAHLTAREGLILVGNFLGVRGLQEAIATHEQRVLTTAARLKTLAPDTDVGSIEALVRAFRTANDAYLRAATAGDVVVAAERYREMREVRRAIDARVLSATAGWSSEFDYLLDLIERISRSITLTLALNVTIMVLGVGTIFALMVFSVIRPLGRLTTAVEQLDTPGERRGSGQDGPAEFQAIGRALSKLRIRIREQREAEERLRRSEAKLRQFLESSADMFWELGPDLRFTWVYAANYEIEVDPSRILGRTRWELVDGNPDTDPLWREHRQTLLDRSPFRNFEYRLRYTEASEPQWVHVSGVPVFEADGTFKGYRGTAVNVTRQKDVAEQLRQTQRREAMGRLTGGVAHDFNNLLTVLRSNIELLDQRANLDGPFKEMIARCMRAIERGAKLTSQLLSFGRRQTLHPVAIDVPLFLDEFVQLIRRTLPANISVTVNVDDAVPPVRADPSLLQDALLNLCLNARDAMPDGGALTLRVERGELLSAAAGHGPTAMRPTVSIMVSDTGTGIPDEVRGQVFEPFFTTKGVGHGSGLGLSMVRGFIEQSAGTVELTSQPGEGTTVRLALPVASRELPLALPVKATGHLKKGTGERILLVEDEEDVRASIATILDYLGYDAVPCASGDEAAAMLHARMGRFDAVVSDIMMPGALQGDDLAAKVRAEWPDLPVILMCGYIGDALREDIDALGFPVLDKPIATEQLQRALSTCLDHTIDVPGSSIRAHSSLG